MKFKFFIGIDISKATLDIAVLNPENICTYFKVDNSEQALIELLGTLKKDFKSTRVNTFFCAEQMGIYGTFLRKVCVRKKLTICLESALHLKRTLGIQRGKNDKMDALRIAQYAQKNFQSLKAWQPPRPEIIELKNLTSIRRRLMKMKVMCGNVKIEETFFLSAAERKRYENYQSETIKAIKGDMERVEKDIERIIKSDARLSELKRIIMSVPLIGKVTCNQLIILTNEFESSWTARRFASYCGIAPFEYSSGTSVRGRTKVSHLANKEIKSLLHMASLGCTKSKKSFLGKYYTRKLEEGKPKMTILNAVRNKIIARVFACVHKNELFKEYNNI